MKLPILIASSTFDEHAYGPVRHRLEQRGYPVIVYRTDRLLSGVDSFVLRLISGAPNEISYNGTSIIDDDLGAAWYRKVASFALPDAATQLAKQLYMNNEVRALHDTIWPSVYSEDVWLSAPGRIAHADRKLAQLAIAASVGFRVPDTMITSDWKSVEDSLITQQDAEIVVKMMRGVISVDDNIRALWTTILDGPKISAIRHKTTPFPGLYQPYLEKVREWRVTVVGQDVFAVAIYVDDCARDDWRKHQNSTAVKFKVEQLPGEAANQCLAYLREMSLGFGAFDLIEGPDGQITFLECNPNGQYGWVEDDLNLKISDSISSRLIAISRERA